jgi:hypothetical protein
MKHWLALKALDRAALDVSGENVVVWEWENIARCDETKKLTSFSLD